MFVTRRVEFSASHVCRLPGLSEQENLNLFGPESRPNGHGHNYILEVTIEGEPDPVTGMVMNLKNLKDVLEEQIIEPMDHRFLNTEVKPFDEVIPTTENIARNIWERLVPVLDTAKMSLSKIRLFETGDLYVEIAREAAYL